MGVEEVGEGVYGLERVFGNWFGEVIVGGELVGFGDIIDGV